jgi:hypothetical protein
MAKPVSDKPSNLLGPLVNYEEKRFKRLASGLFDCNYNFCITSIGLWWGGNHLNMSVLPL